jgi:hypothetical protein
LCCGYLCFLSPLYANDGSVEYKVKAGYIYNFTKFITWPQDTSATFNLCILGRDPFGTLIDPIEQRTASSKPIRLLRLGDINALRSLGKSTRCHILFVSIPIDDPLPAIQESKSTLLTVGESRNFAGNGGMIGFVTDENGRIKLQINLDTFKRSNLKISAKLLEVADIIRDDAHD